MYIGYIFMHHTKPTHTHARDLEHEHCAEGDLGELLHAPLALVCARLLRLPVVRLRGGPVDCFDGEVSCKTIRRGAGAKPGPSPGGADVVKSEPGPSAAVAGTSPSKSRCRCGLREPQSRWCRCGQERARSPCRCGRGKPSFGADRWPM
jgi:hypothetical protein